MIRHDLSDAALVLLGHGTTQNDGSALAVTQHVAELGRRGLFVEVRAAFWKQEPHFKQVLAEVQAQRVYIVPLFISDGYYSGEVIPRELGLCLTDNLASRTVHRGSRITFYCRPVGTHDRMTEVILTRARKVVAEHPFPHSPKPKDITLFIAGHGTQRNANSRKSLERQVELIREKQLYAAVHAVFMEEMPRIPESYSLAETRNLVVVPFFISDGLHSVEDIPVLLGEPERIVKLRLAAAQPTWRNPTERNGKLVWYSAAVGSEPGIAEVLLERVREMAEAPDVGSA